MKVSLLLMTSMHKELTCSPIKQEDLILQHFLSLKMMQDSSQTSKKAQIKLISSTIEYFVTFPVVVTVP